MPVEQRQLLFTAAEVLAAVREHLNRTGQRPPSGRMVRAGVQNDSAGLRFAMVVETGASTQSVITVEEAALAAALIMFCRDRSIPLPRKAEKSLAVIGEELALRINKDASSFIGGRRMADRP